MGNHPLLVFYCQDQAFGMAALMHSQRYEDRQQYVRFASDICLAKLQLHKTIRGHFVDCFSQKKRFDFNVE